MNAGLVLGIETSGKSTGLALATAGRVVAELVEDSGCGHNETLMPLLDRLFKDTGISVSQLTGIGVDIGPGMFTSLRVGLSTAKGLAIAHRIPVVGLGSLWGLACTARPDLDRVLALIDARKQQVYAALYVKGEAAIPPSVMNPGELASAVVGVLSGQTSLVAAGNGTGTCSAPFAAAGIRLDASGTEVPSAGVIAVAAGARIAQARTDDLASLEPLYLRRTDAELTREQKLGSKH
jgi:tRNA threonylcarbamoyladenosine biosynthesis protein TsaB